MTETEWSLAVRISVLLFVEGMLVYALISFLRMKAASSLDPRTVFYVPLAVVVAMAIAGWRTLRLVRQFQEGRRELDVDNEDEDLRPRIRRRYGR